MIALSDKYIYKIYLTILAIYLKKKEIYTNLKKQTLFKKCI